MHALLLSTGLVALAEIGDKTQLLSLLLAARFRAPLPIIAGIFVATVLNHALAALVGQQVAAWLDPQMLRWLLALSFFALAAWMLVPDRLDDDDAPASRYGPFLATTIAFFLAEMGDKTQIATVMLGARFTETTLVVLGTTLGMMLANAPVVWAGNMSAGRLPMKAIHLASAGLFVALGIAALVVV